MSEWYKFEPLAWDRGTDNLSLEQEAAYLRVCNSIYASDQPLAENYRVLGGLWRCNERKAKRLLSELVNIGKLEITDGFIYNERAMDDVSIRLQLRVKRQLAGHAGGIESGKSRRKALISNKVTEANGSTREEEKRIDKKQTKSFDEFWSIYPKKAGKKAAVNAHKKALREVDHSKLMDGLRRYVTFRKVKEGYILNPATWLNGGHWDDEEEPKANGATSKADMYRSMI